MPLSAFISACVSALLSFSAHTFWKLENVSLPEDNVPKSDLITRSPLSLACQASFIERVKVTVVVVADKDRLKKLGVVVIDIALLLVKLNVTASTLSSANTLLNHAFEPFTVALLLPNTD